MLESEFTAAEAGRFVGVSAARFRELAENVGVEPVSSNRGPLWGGDDVKRVAWKLAAIGSKQEKSSARAALRMLKAE